MKVMVGLLSFLAASLPTLQQDPVTYSFAFFGCNRVDKADWHKKKNPSSANLPQLHQSFKDISNISPMPKALFMTGDLVLGYKDDKGEEVRKQLDAWLDEYKKSPLNGKITMVPLSGNHEMNRKVDDNKVASPYTTEVWNDWIRTNHLPPAVGNGPKPGGPDHVTDDQSLLNFSFDAGKLHFICLNTDTRVSTDDRIGFVPAAWAKADIEAASKRGQTIFLLGHRNVVDGDNAKGDAPIEAESGTALMKAMESNPNVVGYLCAHVHAWDVSRINHARVWQVIAGNGGSPLEKTWEPKDGKTFGFAVIEVHKSGRIDLVPYFREAKERYDDEDVKPAKAQTPIELGRLANS